MLLSLLALALVDSINPSAIVVTLYLLERQREPARVVVYVAAIFVTYPDAGRDDDVGHRRVASLRADPGQ